MQKNLEILRHSISPPLIVALLFHVLATHQATAGEQNNHLLIHKKNIATIATYNTEDYVYRISNNYTVPTIH